MPDEHQRAALAKERLGHGFDRVIRVKSRSRNQATDGIEGVGQEPCGLFGADAPAVSNLRDLYATFPSAERNFLDLSYTGFYDGIQFHRVSPTFMIQGGCPETKTPNQSRWGTGRGPRMLDAEFSETLHERGVLSMARSSSPNSASSQFFVMTARSAALDNKYSVFGQMVSGDPTLTKISNAPGKAARDGTIRPSEPQRIEQARVLKPVQ